MAFIYVAEAGHHVTLRSQREHMPAVIIHGEFVAAVGCEMGRLNGLIAGIDSPSEALHSAKKIPVTSGVQFDVLEDIRYGCYRRR
jgi:hypothetical protein